MNLDLFNIKNLNALIQYSEKNRIQFSSDIYAYLMNDYIEMKNILRRRMKENNKIGAPDEWELACINILPKIVKNLATIYADRPEISVYNASGTVNEDATALYEELGDRYGWWTARRRLNEFLVAFNTMHTELSWRNEKIEIDHIPPHLMVVETDPKDYLTPVKILVPYDGAVIGLTGQTVYKTYTNTGSYWANSSGNYIVGIDETSIFDNWIISRIEKKDTYWGDGITDVAHINTEINMMLTSLLTYGLYQGGGILFGVNITDSTMVTLGPNKMIGVQSKGVTEVPPSLQYISPSSNAANMIAIIEALIKNAYNTHGLSAATYSMEAVQQSGVAKIIDNAEMIEARKTQIEVLRSFEQELFKKVQIIYNDKVKNGEIKGVVLEGAGVWVDYAEPTPFMDESTRLEILQKKIELGIADPFEYVKEENSDVEMTDEEAEKKWTENIEKKNRLNDKFGGLFNNSKVFNEQA